jgi:hypothetical protein
MGRSSDYLESKVASPLTADSTALAEALLGSTMQKRKQSLLIQFDDLRDANFTHRYLVGLQSGYRAPRK